MLQIHKFIFNPLEENCYVVWDDTRECAIVDPGCHEPSERQSLVRFIEDNNLIPKLILITHTHMDHVFGVRDLCNRFGIEAYMDPRETITIMAIDKFDFNPVTDGQEVCFGLSRAKALSTPGHSMGGLCWWFEADKVMFTGDSLFCGSIGRTDLPGGDLDALMDSLHNVLMEMDGEIEIYPGHGPGSDIARERQTNPFLFDEDGDWTGFGSAEDDGPADGADGSDGLADENGAVNEDAQAHEDGDGADGSDDPTKEDGGSAEDGGSIKFELGK